MGNHLPLSPMNSVVLHVRAQERLTKELLSSSSDHVIVRTSGSNNDSGSGVITGEEVRLTDIMSDRELHALFTQFVQKERSMENILFWTEAQELAAIPMHSHDTSHAGHAHDSSTDCKALFVQQRARHIYRK